MVQAPLAAPPGGRPGALGSVDEACERVSAAAPYAGFLALTAMPSRLLLVHLVTQAFLLGRQAQQHGTYLLHLAYATLGLWVVSLYGRQVFLRACRMTDERLSGSFPFRVPPRELAGALMGALWVEVAFWGLSFTGLVPLFMLVGGALAAAAAPQAGPGLFGPLAAMARARGKLSTQLGLLLTFFAALLLAALSLQMLASLLAWAASLVAPGSVAVWSRAFDVTRPLYAGLLLAGATLLVEPFWLAAWAVHVERVRAVSTGEDLQAWFQSLKPLATAAVLLLALRAQALTLPEYRARLATLERTLSRGDRADAAKEARSLQAESVRWRGETLTPDPSVLQPIAQGRVEGTLEPLRRLRMALGQDAEAPPIAVDRERLTQLVAANRPTEIRKGGELPDLVAPRLSLPERLTAWLQEHLRALWRWLVHWFLHRKVAVDRAPAGGLQRWVFVTVGIIAALLVLLALRALRPRPAVEPILPAPRGAGDADADPLSRDVDEWERRAQALSGEGRWREAIRAWYHAVLVAAYRSGTLHYRKGRTNREYAQGLGDAVPWRSDFVELTGRFDLEWYGHTESTAFAQAHFSTQATALLGRLATP